MDPTAATADQCVGPSVSRADSMHWPRDRRSPLEESVMHRQVPLLLAVLGLTLGAKPGTWTVAAAETIGGTTDPATWQAR